MLIPAYRVGRLVTEMREVKHPYTRVYWRSGASTTRCASIYDLFKRDKRAIEQTTPPEERRVRTRACG